MDGQFDDVESCDEEEENEQSKLWKQLYHDVRFQQNQQHQQQQQQQNVSFSKRAKLNHPSSPDKQTKKNAGIFDDASDHENDPIIVTKPSSPKISNQSINNTATVPHNHNNDDNKHDRIIISNNDTLDTTTTTKATITTTTDNPSDVMLTATFEEQPNKPEISTITATTEDNINMEEKIIQQQQQQQQQQVRETEQYEHHDDTMDVTPDNDNDVSTSKSVTTTTSKTSKKKRKRKKSMEEDTLEQRSQRFLTKSLVHKKEVQAISIRFCQIVTELYDIYKSQGIDALHYHIFTELAPIPATATSNNGGDKSSKKKKLRNDDEETDDDDESDEDMTEMDDANDVDKFGCVNINNDDNDNAEVDSNDSNEKTTEECVGLMNPRQYQLELYQYVRRQNTIVMLGTGQGKTLIAILSMKYFLEIQPKKQVWCLVPSVALAVQQANVIRANLPYRVGVVCHTSDHSDNARADWSAAHILVATHGSALELLRHYGDIFTMSGISLLVLDECHYATKQHSYAVLMRNFYHAPTLNKNTINVDEEKDDETNCRPRILGLTASPLINITVEEAQSKSTLELKLQQLEKLLGNAKLVTWSQKTNDDDDDDNEEQGLLKNDALRKEYIVKFCSSSLDVPLEIQIQNPTTLHPSRIKECQQLIYLYHELGSTVLGYYCNVLQLELTRNYFELETFAQFQQLLCYLKRVEIFCTYHPGKTDRLNKLESLIALIYNNSTTSTSENNAMSDGDEEKKVENDTVGIVFVERRITALALKNYFLRIYSDTDNSNKINAVKCDVLTRKTTNIFKYLNQRHHNQTGKKSSKSNSQKGDNKEDTNENNNDNNNNDANKRKWLHKEEDTKKVLDRLRKRDVNMLLCTSIVEEGVDVDACSYVIVLNDLKTSKSYIQCKGRARQSRAKFFVFQDSSKKKASVTLLEARHVEHLVKEYISQRGNDELIQPDLSSKNTAAIRSQLSNCSIVEDSSMQGDDDDNDDDEYDEVEKLVLQNKQYNVDHGLVDFASAKSLINRYAMSVPMENCYRSNREALQMYLPVYQENKLYLPAHLPSHVRTVKLPKSFNNAIKGKREKEYSLALLACVRLHRLNILNDRLLPLKRDDIHRRLLSFALAPLSRLDQHNESISSSLSNLPSPDKCSKKVFLYIIHQTGNLFERHGRIVKDKGYLALMTCEQLKSDSFSESFLHKDLDKVHVKLSDPKKVFLTEDQLSICCEFYTILMNVRWRRRKGNKRFKLSDTFAFRPSSSLNDNTTTAVKNTPVLFPEYLVTCVTDEMDLDWDRMNQTNALYHRTDTERLEAANKTTTSDGIPKLWSPTYDSNNIYIVYPFLDSGKDCSAPFDDEEYATFQDYYQTKRSVSVSLNCPLLFAQHIWEFPKSSKEYTPKHNEKAQKTVGSDNDDEKPSSDRESMTKGDSEENNICENLGTVLLPKQVCAEAQLPDASLVLKCVFLPQILYLLELLEQTHSFVHYCKEKIPILGMCFEKIPISCVKEALTAKSCTLPTPSYDRLEYLGDAVLKLVHTQALISTEDNNLNQWISCLHEGDLSALRSAMGCNERLCHAAEAAGIDQFILSKSLGRGKWLSSGLETYMTTVDGEKISITTQSTSTKKKKKKSTDENLELVLSDKVKADVIESLIGLLYLHCGFEKARSMIEDLSLSLTKNTCNELRATSAFNSSRTSSQHIVVNDGLVSDACSFLGLEVKQIRNTSLLLEATCHPSHYHAQVPSYQRLEWVGDAVLCLAAREWVYKQHPTMPVKLLVQIETTLICNETLAFLGFSAGLHRHISHYDTSLPERLDSYERLVGKVGLWGSDPPKTLADIVEALLGATHLECGLQQGQQSALHILKPTLPFLKKQYSTCANNLIHPKQQLFELCQFIKVKSYSIHDYVLLNQENQRELIWYGNEWGGCDENRSSYVGIITWYGISLCIVADDRSNSLAKNRACALLTHVLKQSQEALEQLKEMSVQLAPLLS